MSLNKKPEWPFYVAWVVLTALCVPAGFVLYFIIIKIVVSVVGDFIVVDGVQHITEDYLLGYIFVPVTGLLAGLVQYVLLRHYLPDMGWWVPATLLGWSAGMLFIYGLMEVVSEIWSMEAYFAGVWSENVAFLQLGLAIGFWQWLVLRRQVPGAWWWIVANLAGWGLVALFVQDALGQLGAVALGTLPALATAVCLALLLNQAPIEPETVQA